MPLPFEINIPPLTGQITKAELYEEGGVNPPKNVISAGQAWGVDVEWELCGYLAPWLPGAWKLELLLERMGEGPEPTMPPGGVSVPLADGIPGGGCLKWSKKVEVGAGSAAPGTYHVVMQLTWEPAPGTAGPIVGFADIELVRIY